MAGYTRQHHYIRVGQTIVSTEVQILRTDINECWFTHDKLERIIMMMQGFLINEVDKGLTTYDQMYFAEDDLLAVFYHFKKKRCDFVLTRKKNLQNSNGGNYVGYFEFPYMLFITVNQKRSLENKVNEIKDIESYSKIMESDEDENVFCPPSTTPKCIIELSRFASKLTVNEVHDIVQSLEKDIYRVFNGEVTCRRHEAFKNGGNDKAYLRMQTCSNILTDEHEEVICHYLLKMFCAKKSKHFDYIMKVLLPETITMFYAKVANISIEEARNMINSV
nr:uncharacterized protein LOC101237982 isoform X2 [Hydra vulgaris]